MKKMACLLFIILSVNSFSKELKAENFTDLKKGCEIMTGLADLSMHHRQRGSSYKLAQKSITVDKFINSSKIIDSQKKKSMGLKLESLYLSILEKTYKYDIVENKQEIIERYTTNFYKECLISKARF